MYTVLVVVALWVLLSVLLALLLGRMFAHGPR